jgi:hypothetical protein
VVSTVSNPAVVAIDLRDADDHPIGSCTGTLVSSSVVLTAGHCVVAMSRALVTTSDGQTAGASQVWSTWQNFQSAWSHPMHSDVGVILLDHALNEPSYPSLGGSMASDGQTLARVRRPDPLALDAASFEQVTESVSRGDAMGFPLAYTMPAASFEGETDTGGPLLDPGSNTIYGVVSGVGRTTGTVYVSRIDYLSAWVSQISTCNPPPIQTQCHHGGSGGSGSSGGSSSSSSGGQSSSGSGSGGGSGGWSSSGAGSGSSSGSSGSSSGSGWSSSGGGGGGGPCTPPGPPPPPTGGDDGGTSSGGFFGGSSGSGSGGGTASSSSGSSSGGPRIPNPGEPLVPDGPGCYDDSCGGCTDDPGCSDGQTDYGGCGCEPGGTYEAGPIQ